MSADRAEALLRSAFPGLEVIEVIHHDRRTMTEQTAPAAPEAEGVDWGDVEPAVQPTATYPEIPDNPHNHLFTVSMDGRGPMIVVRANTAREINERFQELESAGTLSLLGSLAARLKGAPPAPPALPAMPAPPQGGGVNYNPQMPPPGIPGQAPAAWQNAGAPAMPQAPQGPQVPPGWYKLNVPFPQKGAFDAVVAQYGIRKGDPTRGGQVSFQKASKSWYCSPEVAGAFQQFSPVPA